MEDELCAGLANSRKAIAGDGSAERVAKRSMRARIEVRWASESEVGVSKRNNCCRCKVDCC